MSIFQTAKDPDASGTANHLEDLVGEGKKFKTPEELAKGKKEADEFIERLKNEQKELREELQKQLAISQALQRKQENGEDVEPPSQPTKPAPTTEQKKEVDLSAEIAKALEQRDRKNRIETNIDLVTKTMTEAYGSVEKAAEIIKTRADELGMTVEQLQTTAADNPKAFFRLVGVDGQQSVNGPKTTSWTKVKNPTAFKQEAKNSVTQPGTYKWYQDLRRSDPARFFSPQVQLQMDKDAREKGDAFYS